MTVGQALLPSDGSLLRQIQMHVVDTSTSFAGSKIGSLPKMWVALSTVFSVTSLVGNVLLSAVALVVLLFFSAVFRHTGVQLVHRDNWMVPKGWFSSFHFWIYVSTLATLALFFGFPVRQRYENK